MMTMTKKENSITFTSPIGTNGRIGNTLFQIAATYSLFLNEVIKTKNNAPDDDCVVSIGFPAWEHYKHFKNLPKQNEQYQIEKFDCTHVYREQSFHYTEIDLSLAFEIKKIPNQKIIDVHGYFQSEKYFINNKKIVLSALELSDEIINKCSNVLRTIAETEKNGLKFTSIHLRFGDYLENPYYFNLPSSDYYNRAIEKMVYEKGRQIFLIFSDDKPLARKAIEQFQAKHSEPILCYIIDGLSDIQELCLMSLCSNHITANSSYSWWGSYLCKNETKLVIMPSRWFDGNGLKNETKDLYYEGTTVI